MEALQKNNLKPWLRLLAELTGEGFIAQHEELIVEVSDSVAAMLGYKARDLVGVPISTVLKRAAEAPGRPVDSLTASVQGVGVRRDGTRFPVRMRSRRLNLGGRLYTVALIRGLTVGEARPVLEDDRYYDFVRAASDWCWETDADLNLVAFHGLYAVAALREADNDDGFAKLDAVSLNSDSKATRRQLEALSARRSFRDLVATRRIPGQPTTAVRLSGVPVYDNDGRFQGYRGVGVEERVEAESQIRDADLLRSLEHLPAGVAVFDAKDRLIRCNARFRAEDGVEDGRILPGVTFVEILRHRLRDGLYPDAIADERTWFETRLAAHRNPPAQFEQRTRNGRWQAVHEWRTAEGGTLTVVMDITDSKRLAEAGGERRTAYRELLDQAPFPALIVDVADGRIAQVSGKSLALLAGDAEALIGRPFAELVDSETGRERLAEAMSAGGSVEGLELPMRGTGEAALWVAVALSRIELEGKPAFFVTLADMTARKQAEDALLLAKEEADRANRGKTEFIAHISHELRTPLNAILGFSEIIRDRLMKNAGPEVYAEYGADIHASGTHLLSLVNDLLDLSKIETGRVDIKDEVIPLTDFVADVLKSIAPTARERGVRLSVDLDTEVGHVMADRRALRQMLLNLLSNAIKFSHHGGRVTIRSTLGDDGLHLAVEDEGIGIASDALDDVLEPFFTVPDISLGLSQGAGLGLAIVASLIRLHDGRVNILSEPGQGTTVTLIFPRARVPELAVERAANSA